ncbi:MAG TPA: hypothetical protein VGP47_10885 [Parachlamydiaceae bacterium]|nr:hypothetical protein [Parachlamydiaceae bacterium]
MLLVLNKHSNLQNSFSAGIDAEGLITSLPAIHAKLPQYSCEVIQGLFDIMRGPEGGCMSTLGLVASVTNDKTYKIDGQGIKQSKELFAVDLETEANNPSIVLVPAHLEFKAEWNKQTITSGEGNNILGDNGGLYFDVSAIQVPAEKATKETLAYYGAVLISENSAIRFPSDEAYPLWKMQVGTNYVRDYIMVKDSGGGYYLEYHHDQPHFHMVIDGGGHYLLAKEVSEGTFHITAFELSNGDVVYTKKGAIHCDAALTGELIVGYTASEDCSTVLLRTKNENQMVNVEFV